MRKLQEWKSEPPTVYALLNSYVNYGKDVPVKIKDLAKAGRSVFFDFEYPLTPLISREDFECMILNHFLMRRIGYETFTAFNIALNVKLNEIMPNYNKLFESLNGWELFDGESTVRDVTRENVGTNNAESDGTSNGTSDRRFSKLPQNKLENLRNGTYVTDYNYDQDDNTSHTATTINTTDNNVEHEEVHHTLANKYEVYSEFLKNRTNIYTMIFEDLEQLFYQLA